MEDKIVLGCRCNPRVRIELSHHEFKYLNRTLSLIGFDNVDWTVGLKIFECHSIGTRINDHLENNTIVESRHSKQPLPFLNDPTVKSNIHFVDISLKSRLLLCSFTNLMRKSLGVQRKDNK